jgi:hypothetical protein
MLSTGYHQGKTKKKVIPHSKQITENNYLKQFHAIFHMASVVADKQLAHVSNIIDYTDTIGSTFGFCKLVLCVCRK